MNRARRADDLEQTERMSYPSEPALRARFVPPPPPPPWRPLYQDRTLTETTAPSLERTPWPTAAYEAPATSDQRVTDTQVRSAVLMVASALLGAGLLGIGLLCGVALSRLL